MSILKVDTINEKTSGNGVAIPGHVIQVQKSVFSGSSPAFTTTSWVSFSRSVVITPKFANSLILVAYSATAYATSGAQGYFSIYRNGTSLYNSSGYSTNATHQALCQLNSGNSTVYFPGCTLTFMDSDHNSTSALTYTMYGKNSTASANVYWPPGSVDAATFTAMEVAQ